MKAKTSMLCRLSFTLSLTDHAFFRSSRPVTSTRYSRPWSNVNKGTSSRRWSFCLVSQKGQADLSNKLNCLKVEEIRESRNRKFEILRHGMRFINV